jgi:hypothetical protein
MVLASVEPQWLHTIGQIAGTLLVLELLVVLLVVLVLAGVLAYGLWWLRSHVVPVLDQYGSQARQIMEKTTQGTDRVMRTVAEVHGRKEAAQTILRVLLFGRPAARQEPVAPHGPAPQSDRQATGDTQAAGFAPRDVPEPPLSTHTTPSTDLAPLSGER